MAQIKNQIIMKNNTIANNQTDLGALHSSNLLKMKVEYDKEIYAARKAKQTS